MLIDIVIKKAYDILIDGLLYGIDNEDKEEVSRNYMNYLRDRYSNIEVNKENIKDCLKDVIRKEKRDWEDQDLNYRLRLLKTDKSFSIIRNISNQGFELAYSRLQNSENTITTDEANKNIDVLINELNSVNDYNKERARNLVSEGILDFQFASGNDELMSFRLYHSDSNTNTL